MPLIRSHKILIFYTAVLLVCLIFNLLSLLLFLSFRPNAYEISPDSLTSGDETLAYRLLDQEDNTCMTFTTEILKPDLALPGEGDYAVVIYQLNCQSYRISFNGETIGTVGNMNTGNSNIWNALSFFYLDADKILETNTLSIETLCRYDRGFTFKPVYIMKTNELNDYIGFATYFTQSINHLGIGFAIFAAIITFMLYLVSSPRDNAFLFFSLALLFSSFYTLDFTTIHYIPFDYLVYKKLIFLALYLAVSLASLGMYKFFRCKTDLILACAAIGGYLLIVVFTQDMISFKRAYNFFSVIVLLNMISWLVSSYRHLKKKNVAVMFFIGNLLLLCYALVIVIVSLTGSIFSLSTPFSYSFVFSMVSIIVFFSEFVNRDYQLELINNAHKESYLASITDGLTGLYNHRHLINVLRQMAPPFSVAMLDIDDFKEINDNYGHRFGDEIIRLLSHHLKSLVRSTDFVFRYGGDEFFIIFPNCSAENAKDVLQKIQSTFNHSATKNGDHIVAVTFSAGVYYVSSLEDVESVFNNVDSPLYRSKKEGKNKVIIFNIND